VNDYYGRETMLLHLAHAQAHERRQRAARQRLARAAQGPRPLRRRLGLALIALGWSLATAPREAYDEHEYTIATA